jgi:hypothetical protein
VVGFWKPSATTGCGEYEGLQLGGPRRGIGSFTSLQHFSTRERGEVCARTVFGICQQASNKQVSDCCMATASEICTTGELSRQVEDRWFEYREMLQEPQERTA